MTRTVLWGREETYTRLLWMKSSLDHTSNMTFRRQRAGRLLVIGWRRTSATGCLHVSEQNSDGTRKLTWPGGATPEDGAVTITRITAQSIAEAYRRWGPPGGAYEVCTGGGGSYNPNIVNYLREQLPHTRFALIDEIEIPAGAKEALGFSLLGLESFVGRPMMVPKNVE